MADDKNDDTKKDSVNGNSSQTKMSPAEERSEYFKKLEKWLHEAYALQSVATIFPYYVMSGQIINPPTGAPTSSPQVSTTSAIPQVIADTNDQQNDGSRQRRTQEPTGPQVQPPAAEGYEYRIPPIWKRFAAEFIDATILLLLKLSFAFIAFDVFDYIDRDDLQFFHTHMQTLITTIDYKMGIEMYYEIVLLDVMHRLLVCSLEAYWLQHGVNGRVGGTTPGKSLMGLRVVQCRSVTPVDRPESPDVVLVSPGTDLGLPLAVGRSVMKNLILAFMFPIYFAFFFFRFNRTGYDLVCNSIVVEEV